MGLSHENDGYRIAQAADGSGSAGPVPIIISSVRRPYAPSRPLADAARPARPDRLPHLAGLFHHGPDLHLLFGRALQPGALTEDLHGLLDA
ncbi:hypothetical protein ADL21_35755, partial [Streptomyces albus subsp. albus]